MRDDRIARRWRPPLLSRVFQRPSRDETKSPKTETEDILTSLTVQRALHAPPNLAPSEVLSLQRTMGNHAVGNLLRPTIQREEDESTEEDEVKQIEREDEVLSEAGISENDTGQDIENKEEQSSTGTSTSPAESSYTYDRYRGRGRYSPPAKPKRTFKQKMVRFGKIAKHLFKAHTIRSYGKGGLHAIIAKNERTLDKIERMIETDPNRARYLLQYGVAALVKTGIGGTTAGKGVRLVAAAPIFMARVQIAHARWKRMVRQTEEILGIEKPEPQKLDGDTGESPSTDQTPEQTWQQGRPEYKDFYGELHTWMLGGSSKGRGMSEHDRRRERQKWRLRELSDPGVIAGKHRHQGWMPGYSRERKPRWNNKGPTVGSHRPEWKFTGPTLGSRSHIEIGKHRPEWGFQKPDGDKSGLELGAHRHKWQQAYARFLHLPGTAPIMGNHRTEEEPRIEPPIVEEPTPQESRQESSTPIDNSVSETPDSTHREDTVVLKKALEVTDKRGRTQTLPAGTRIGFRPSGGYGGLRIILGDRVVGYAERGALLSAAFG